MCLCTGEGSLGLGIGTAPVPSTPPPPKSDLGLDTGPSPTGPGTRQGPPPPPDLAPDREVPPIHPIPTANTRWKVTKTGEDIKDIATSWLIHLSYSCSGIAFQHLKRVGGTGTCQAYVF